jgi:thioredoxin reductase
VRRRTLTPARDEPNHFRFRPYQWHIYPKHGNQSRLPGRPGATETRAAAALFVMIGATPFTDWLAGAIQRDRNGFVLTGSAIQAGAAPSWAPQRAPRLLEASLPGVFAVGDVGHGPIKRVS